VECIHLYVDMKRICVFGYIALEFFYFWCVCAVCVNGGL
jgi:hypothetical protein